MKTTTVLLSTLFLPCLVFSQDLELDVHVLPTSIIGDPALFNITVRNKDEEPVQGVEVKITVEDGLEFSSFTKKSLDFDPATGIWRIGEVSRYKAHVLGIIAKYAKRDNAILSAEIIKRSGVDPDSTPGNGIDTNGNGKIVNDKGGMKTTVMLPKTDRLSEVGHFIRSLCSLSSFWLKKSGICFIY